MATDMAYELIKLCLTQGAMMVAPFVAVALVTGITISIVQTVTSIQEQTLSFVPKLFMAVIAIWLFAPWVLERFKLFVTLMFQRAGEVLL